VRKLDLDGRLNAYFATLRTSPLRDALKRSVENWHVYAAVTGSAVAMATNASAGVIYSGLLNITAAVGSVQTGAHYQSVSRNIQLKNSHGASIGVGFDIEAFQANSIDSAGQHFRFGAADIHASEVDFLLSNDQIKRLSSGARISGGGHTVNRDNGFVAPTSAKFVAQRQSTSGRRGTFGWSKATGFAGFVFSTTADHQRDFGWVRLQYTVGTNDLINSLTVIDWGYQNSGAAITAGNEGNGTPVVPEPSTGALALLAAGAAGVTALRRHRKASANAGADADPPTAQSSAVAAAQ
jgi:hypothetical protein